MTTAKQRELLVRLNTVWSVFIPDERDKIVLACNTAHLLLPQLQACIAGQFVSLIDTTVGHLNARAVNKVGLLASPTTIRTGLYEHPLSEQGIQTIVPSAHNVDRIETLIRRIIGGERVPIAELSSVARDLERRGAELILLGCTELSVIAGQEPLNKWVDPLRLISEQLLSI